MKFLQTYYTSCQQGQLGGSGFQFYSHSKGLDDEELKEIGILGNYTSPMNMPTQPTEQEIRDLFPVAFSYFRLTSGRVGICKSVYLGKDYSGRYGNFFAHCLILESGEFPIHPIHFYHADFFKTNLSEEEKNISTIPAPLPILSLDKVEKDQKIEFSAIGDFLSDERESIFKSILNSQLAYEKTKRKIVFSDDPANAIFWIAAITQSFPMSIAKSITFSTYSLDPINSNLVLNHTLSEGTRFDFQNTRARDFQYFIFDIQNKNFSQIELAYQFSDFVPFAFSIDEGKLLDFHTFLERFNYEFPNEELDHALGLFNILASNTKYENLNFETLTNFVEFISKYDQGNVAKQLLDLIKLKDNNYYLIKILPDFDALIFFLKFLFGTIEKEEDDSLKSFACEFYSDTIISFLDNEGNGIAQENISKFLSFNDSVLALPFSKKEVFVDHLLAPQRLGLIEEIVSDVEQNRDESYPHFCAGILYANYLKHFYRNNKSQFLTEFLSKKIVALAQHENHLFKILKEISDDTSLFSNQIIGFRKSLNIQKINDENLLEAFLTLFKERSDQWQESIKQNLHKEEEIEFLLRLILEQFDKKSNKHSFFVENLNQYNSLFEKEPERFKDLFFKYLHSLNIEKNMEFTMEFLDYTSNIKSRNFNQSLIEKLERKLDAIHFEKLDPTLVTAIESKKRFNKIVTSTNRLSVVYIGHHLKSEKTPLSELILRLNDDGEIKSVDKISLFSWIMELITHRIDRPIHYYETIDYVQSQGDLKQSLTTFYRHLLDIGKSELSLVTGLISYLTSEKTEAKIPKLKDHEKVLKITSEIFPELLANRKNSFVESLNKKLVVSKTLETKRYWMKLYRKQNEIRENSGGVSIFKSLKGFLGKKK